MSLRESVACTDMVLLGSIGESLGIGVQKQISFYLPFFFLLKQLFVLRLYRCFS